MGEEEKSNLYVYVYSDYEEDFIFKESKYTLADLHKLQQENQELKEQNQKYKEIIDKAIAHLDLFISSDNLSEYDTLKILMHAKKILKEVE